MTADDGLRGDHSVTPVLRVENLALSIGDHVIFENIYFQVDEGEIAVLIGPNGAGKTMLVGPLLDSCRRVPGRSQYSAKTLMDPGISGTASVTCLSTCSSTAHSPSRSLKSCCSVSSAPGSG